MASTGMAAAAKVHLDTISALLKTTPTFAGLSSAEIDELLSLCELIEVSSGATVYEEGDTPDDVYVVVRGRLRASRGEEVVGYISRLEPVGEMGALLGEPRRSSVRAVRDSVLLRIPTADYMAFLDKYPVGYRSLSRVVIGRLRQSQRSKNSGTEVQGTFAVVPSTDDVPVMELAETMVSRLSGWPAARLITAAHVDAALGEGVARSAMHDRANAAKIANWLDELERRHRYLVFAADSGRDAWSARCVHNADRILVLAEALNPPEPVPVLEELRRHGLVAPVELVLLRPEGDPSPYTMSWRQVTGARAHYFVHPWDRNELDSLARQVTSRGIGVVLGGGGARGFAHIGLIRALEELEIPIDVAGGTSMGAFMAALLACGYNSMDMTEIARETFVRANYLNDYTLPKFSMIRGRKFAARLKDVFGDRLIEELRRTYFCVATNLTTGDALVCDRGPLHLWCGVSMAVPGVAPPIAFEGDLLCDGGVVDNLPTDVMRNLERGKVVACNVSTDGALRALGAGIGEPDPDALSHWQSAQAPPKLGEILVRTATLSSAVAVEAAAGGADVYVRMPVQDFGMFDWKRLDDLVDLGYDHARRQLAPLKDKLV